MEDLGPDLELGQKLIGQNGAGLAEVHGTALGDSAATSTEGGPPAVPVLLDPYRQQQRHTVVADAVRTGRKKNAREDTHIEPERILVQKAIFRGELDVAQTDIRAATDRAVETGGQGCRKLQVGC